MTENVRVSIRNLWSKLCWQVRKDNKGKRFDREKAAKPLEIAIKQYWERGIDELFAHLEKRHGWDKIQRQTQLNHAIDHAHKLHKSLSDADRSLLLDLLGGFHLYGDVDQQARVLIEATSFDTFEEAAKFALGQLGLAAPDFDLKNPQIREELLNRTDAVIFATRNNIDGIFETIINHFYDLGQNPYDAGFIADLKAALGEQADWKAKRFALTETGIAAELAAVTTYRKNGVTGKQWNIKGDNTRPDHEELAGVTIGIDEKFDVGGSEGDHPLDPSLPADQLCNCHCWLTPIVSADYELDPKRIWSGE